jgi:hypothetical protein
VEPYPQTTYALSRVAQETGETIFIYVIYLFNNIKLQHPISLLISDFAFRFFAVYVQRRLNSLVSSLYFHDMFRPDQPSSDVQDFVMKESAVLLSLGTEATTYEKRNTITANSRVLEERRLLGCGAV